MNESKYKRYVLIWGIILIILQTFTLINIINTTRVYASFKSISLFVAVLMLILLVLFLVLSLKKVKAGPIIGIIVGAIYITNLSIINIILGVCFIISCADMLKELKKSN